MKGKVATESNIENGVYEATLKVINIYMADNFDKNGVVPTMTFIWDLGEDENGNQLTCFDPFINVPTDNEGYPKMGGTKSKIYQRLTALTGEKFDPKNVDWELVLPEEYDSLENFHKLPRWDSFSGGNSDMERPKADILVTDVSVTGLECQIELAEVKSKTTGDSRQRVVSCVPMPKKKVTRKAKKSIKPPKEEIKEEIKEDNLPE